MNKLEETVTTFLREQQINLTGQPIVVAVSGGPDSMALLSALTKISKSQNFVPIVAHIDHQLRQDSQQEASLLTKFCQQHQLLLEQKEWPISDHPTKGLEAAARDFRYQFFAETAKKYGTKIVFTAHHGDDLLENVLMKLIRSGDLREMTKPLPVTKQRNLTIVRPLLTCAKEELVAYCVEHKLEYILDSTNQDDFTIRNRVRHHLVPLLRAENSAILKNVQFMQKQLSQLTDAVVSLAATITQPEILHGFHDGIYVGQRDALADFNNSQKALIFEQLIFKYLHKSIKVELKRFVNLKENDSNQVIELKQKVKIILGQNDYYLVDGELLAKRLAQLPQSVAVETPFRVGPRIFVISTGKYTAENYFLRGQFTSSKAASFKLHQIVEGDRVSLSNGAHQLLKKRFSPRGIPAALRSYFWGIADADNGRLLWVDLAYTNQLTNQDDCEYYFYEELKKHKEK